MPSRYDQLVDPAAPNNAHSFALDLVGWNRRVLELGAASGHMTRALAERRCEVTAIEYDADAAADIGSAAAQVIVGDLNDLRVFDDLTPTFDVILAGDVLEHLSRPDEVLARVSRLLRPGGHVVVSLPHIGHVDARLSLFQGDWEYRPWGLLDDTHTRFFTLKSIERMVRHAGLVMTELRRVVVPAFETELNVQRSAVPTELLELALADPEAETYQFVFSAVQDDGDYKTRRLAEKHIELQRRLDQAQLEQRILSLEVSALQGELRRAEHAMSRLDESVVWQTFQRVRRIVYRAAGGEQSRSSQRLQSALRRFGRSFASRSTKSPTRSEH